MPDVFKTRKGDPIVEIPGVGLVDDTAGVPLERAALVMAELQDKNGKPLAGQVLAGAAKKWADRVGLTVTQGPADAEDAPAAVAAQATAATAEPTAAPAAETKE